MITKFMHRETGSIDDMEGWLQAYTAEELEDRGFASAKEAFEHDLADGLLIEQEYCESLQELTGQESGIVLFDSGDAIVCNWSDIQGLPRLSPFGDSVMGLGEQILAVKGKHIDYMADALDGVRFIYANGEEVPTEGKVYRLNEHHATVYAPDDWA